MISRSWTSFARLFLLMLTAELVFLLPFVLPRVFKPTFLKVFELNNFELGTCFSVYGIVAVVAYFFGGIIADKYAPNRLIALSLVLTSLGGFFLLSFPSYKVLLLIYGFWGMSTILFFWAALIKATRIWAGEGEQGFAFGWLDGGRGLVAAIIGAGSVYLFSKMLEVGDIGLADSSQIAFRPVILVSSFTVLFIGILAYFGLPSGQNDQKTDAIDLGKVLILLKSVKTWLLISIVCSAYVGYKITGYFSLYSNVILGLNEQESAEIGSLVIWFRPFTAIIIAFLTLRIRSSKLILFSFIFTLIAASIFMLGFINSQGGIIWFIIVMALALIGIYASRALYFALVKEGGFRLESTGTVVGLVSMLGFTPEIFIGPWTGALIDNNPGLKGFQLTFLVLTAFSLLGIASIIIFRKRWSLPNQK